MKGLETKTKQQPNKTTQQQPIRKEDCWAVPLLPPSPQIAVISLLLREVMENWWVKV